MRVVAAVGVLLMGLSAVLAWVEAPIRGGISGMGFDGGFGMPVGWLVLMVAGIAGAGWWLRSSRAFALCGLCGLGLGTHAVLYFVFADSLLWSLLDENAQYADIMNFSWGYLPANLGIEPTLRTDLLVDTPSDRLVTAFYFAGHGWWLCMAGSLVALVAGLRYGGRTATRWVAFAAIVLLAGEGLMVAKVFVSHHHRERGDRDMARGDYAHAIARYHTALQWNPQMAGDERVQLRLGEIYAGLGMSDRPGARFYLGDLYGREGRLEAALSEYLVADEEAEEPLKGILKRTVALTYIRMGLAQYREGNVGQAIAWYERALASDPSQIHAAYFLTRLYFEQGRYEQSIAMARLLLSQSRNRLLNANIEANLGDAYWALNDGQRARAAYETSMKLDPYANFRIFKSLSGT